mgnify:CR=1 FL=1
MEKKQNVPALRFQGFSGEWEKTTVGKIFEVTRGETLAAPKTSPTQNPVMNYPVYSSQTKNNGLMGYYSEYLFENAITWTTDGANAGTVRFRKGKFYCTNVCGVLLSKQGYANTFMAEALNKVAWKHVSKVGNPKLMNNVMKEISIHAPKTIDEQNELAEYIEKLDLNIFNRMQKIRKLQQFRQAMLAKLFPREGAAEPELRFRGFSGKWKCCRFGDIADIRRGLTYSPSSLRKSGIRVLRASNIQDDTFYIREDDVFVEPDAVNIPMVKNGDILIAAAGGSTRLVGKHAVIYGIEENSVAHGGFMLLASSDYPEFTNALMGANWYRHFVQQFIAGGNGAIGNLNKSDLEEQIVFVPDVAEMEQIGNFFKELDTYISLQQKKLERMQRLKAALLEKLFV